MKFERHLNLFSYLDFRKFLKDFYEMKKKSRAGFSLRTFSKKAGLGSSNLLKRVVDGERNLTENSIIKFAKALELNKKETEFFKNLVYFCQSTTHEKRNLYYKKLICEKSFSTLKPMEKEQYEFFSTWYHSVIKELITSNQCNGCLEYIAKKITPSLTPAQIESSVELLERIGLIRKDTENKWEATDTVVTTGPECTSIVVMNYHKNLLSMTIDKLESIPADQRDVGAVVLGIDKNLIPEIKKRIQEFRQEILKLASDQKSPNEVVILSMQLVPYTKTWEDTDL